MMEACDVFSSSPEVADQTFHTSLRITDRNPKAAGRDTPRPSWATWSRCSSIPTPSAEREYRETRNFVRCKSTPLIEGARSLSPYVPRTLEVDGVLEAVRHSLGHRGEEVVGQGWNAVNQASQFHKMVHAANTLEGQIMEAVEQKKSLKAEIRDIQNENEGIEGRIHAKVQQLKTARREFVVGTLQTDSKIKAVLENEPWMRTKHKKYAMEREKSSARARLRVLKGCLEDRQRRNGRKLLKDNLQQAIVKNNLSTAESNYESVLSQVKEEEEAIEEILSKPSNGTTPYGIFIQDGNVMDDLDFLHLDIEKIHELEPDRRNFYLRHLMERYDQLAGLTAQLRQLVSVTRRFTQTLDLSDTMDWINGKTAEILECATARVLMTDEHATVLWCITGEEEEGEEVRFPTNTGLTGLALSEATIVVSHNPETEDDRFDAEIDRYTSLPTVSMMVAPILSSDGSAQPIGVMQAFNKRSEKQFDDRDRFLVTVLLQQASVALENAAKFESERRKESINQNLLDIGRGLSSEHDFATLSNLIVSKAKNLLNADRCSIFFWDHETRRLHSNMTDASKTEFIVPENSVAGTVAKNGQGVNVVDAYDFPDFNKSFDEKSGYRTCRILCLPIYGSDTRVLGVIQMIKGWLVSAPPKNLWMHEELDPFTRDDEEALWAFCGQAAIALENASLYERMYTQPQFVEELSKGVDLVSAFKLVWTRVKELCPCEEARLVMETESKKGLWSYDCLRESVHRFPCGGVVGATLHSRKCAILDQLQSSAGLSPKSCRSGMRGKVDQDIDRPPGVDTLRSTICTPVFDPENSRKVIAVLQLVNKTNDLPFNRQDEFMLKGFGSQIAVLVQSAQLNNRVLFARRSLDRLYSLVEEMNNVNTQDPFSDQKLHGWLEEAAADILGADSCTLFWLNSNGRPTHPSGSRPRSANAIGHVVSSGASRVEGGHTDVNETVLYTPIRGLRGTVGVMETVGRQKRTKVLGDIMFNNEETHVMQQFCEQIGIFVECCSGGIKH